MEADPGLGCCGGPRGAGPSLALELGRIYMRCRGGSPGACLREAQSTGRAAALVFDSEEAGRGASLLVRSRGSKRQELQQQAWRETNPGGRSRPPARSAGQGRRRPDAGAGEGSSWVRIRQPVPRWGAEDNRGLGCCGAMTTGRQRQAPWDGARSEGEEGLGVVLRRSGGAEMVLARMRRQEALEDHFNGDAADLAEEGRIGGEAAGSGGWRHQGLPDGTGWRDGDLQELDGDCCYRETERDMSEGQGERKYTGRSRGGGRDVPANCRRGVTWGPRARGKSASGAGWLAAENEVDLDRGRTR